jgi:queuine tRNA-ribosyltransferase
MMGVSQPRFRFVLHRAESAAGARRGTFHTPHGPVETPAFMPVGTQATVKGLTIDMVRASGAQMVLANTYHLALRPGEAVVRELGGLHAFMRWEGPILTDSGGFQLFSLAENTKVTERGAVFKSHIDGSKLELTPERAIQIQEALGSDVAMVLDHVIRLPSSDEAVRDACDRSIRWAARCQAAGQRAEQAQFAIVQGGLSAALRIHCAEQLVKLDFPG